MALVRGLFNRWSTVLVISSTKMEKGILLVSRSLSARNTVLSLSPILSYGIGIRLTMVYWNMQTILTNNRSNRRLIMAKHLKHGPMGLMEAMDGTVELKIVALPTARFIITTCEPMKHRISPSYKSLLLLMEALAVAGRATKMDPLELLIGYLRA